MSESSSLLVIKGKEWDRVGLLLIQPGGDCVLQHVCVIPAGTICTLLQL
jgi:hypothetical protein